MFKEQLKNAICNNDLDFLKKYRDKYSIDERFEDEDNDTLLLYSISDQKSFAYKFFLDNDSDITLVNDEKENVLHAIVYSGVEQRLVEFLDNHCIDLNGCAVDGATPLLLAISLDHIGMAKILIQKGADVNIGDIDGITPVHLAAQSGCLDLIIDLVEKGANYLAKTKNGNYPLALAINGDHVDVVKFLYDRVYNR